MESHPPGSHALPSQGSHLAVFIVLAVLTAAMVGASEVYLGGHGGNADVVAGLALVQAVVVLVFGMHLKSETGLVKAVALLPILLVLVLIVLNLQDASALAAY